MAKLYYSNKDLRNDLSEITRQISISDFKPDVIIGPGRGAFVMGVMLSHYYEVPFQGFEWQTRDHEMIKDSAGIESILSKYNSNNILIVDDINDSGATLLGISKVIDDWDFTENNSMLNLHEGLKYATLFDKESSSFDNVEFTANQVKPDEEKWIVFPYEEWWK
jgi:hypoxanthine phosphoribosyltransferase